MSIDQVQALGIVLGAIAAGIAVVAGLWKGGRALLRFVRRVYDFLDQWNGEPARDGRPAVPGVPARLAALELWQRAAVTTVREAVTTVREVKDTVGRVENELKPNGGGSARDALDRIEGHLGTTQPPST